MVFGGFLLLGVAVFWGEEILFNCRWWWSFFFWKGNPHVKKGRQVMEEKVILGIESTIQSHKISEVKMEIS